MSNLGDFSTTRIEPARGPLWPEVKAKLEAARYEFDDADSFTNIAACPHAHPEGSAYCAAMSWEIPDEDGPLFFVECGCGARGPLADDPVEAAAAWTLRTMKRAEVVPPANASRALELSDVEVAGLMIAARAYLRQAAGSDNMSPAVETALGKLEAQ